MDLFSNEVHIWFAYDEQICDPQLLAKYQDLMNNEERSQQKRFYFEEHRHQYLITRALIRTVLSLYVDKIRPDKWKFKKNRAYLQN